MNKRLIIAALFLVFLVSVSWAEQITTVAVVDFSRVIESFYAESQAVREYQKMRESAQADINRQNETITQLTERKVSAEGNGDEALALQLDNEIFRKKQYLQEYVKIKNSQLQAKRASLSESTSFYTEIMQAIENVSLTSGFSVVLNISDQNSNVIWFSKVVDITNDVIEQLTRTKR